MLFLYCSLSYLHLEHVESVQSSGSDDDDIRTGNCVHGNCSGRLSPLKHGDKIVEINQEDTIIGLQSLSILKLVPSFKGINVRVPEYYVLDIVSKRELSLVPHLTAITTLIRSFMSRKILDHNIRFKVQDAYFWSDF